MLLKKQNQKELMELEIIVLLLPNALKENTTCFFFE